jgi:hypothetical protein
MGFKASCILVNEREPGHLVTASPQHDPIRARRIVEVLGLGRHHSRGMTTFDDGIYPQGLVVGAYDGFTIIGHPEIANACLEPRADTMTARILPAFPRAEVLRVGLHSVVNLWSYALFERGSLRRAYGGSHDDGVVLDEGALLAEEEPHFERSAVRDGRRFFYQESERWAEEYDASAYGEELVFEVMGRFFGCRPDRASGDFDPIELPMEAFEREQTRRWWPFTKG